MCLCYAPSCLVHRVHSVQLRASSRVAHLDWFLLGLLLSAQVDRKWFQHTLPITKTMPHTNIGAMHDHETGSAQHLHTEQWCMTFILWVSVIWCAVPESRQSPLISAICIRSGSMCTICILVLTHTSIHCCIPLTIVIGMNSFCGGPLTYVYKHEPKLRGQHSIYINDI